MSKSTPINQLPSQMVSQNTFVNDQQRQMITQAQQAIGNSTIPQNTTLPNDILTEDDSVIQDMLNNLNAGQASTQQQMQDLQQQEEFLRMAAMNNMNINQVMQQPQQHYMPPPTPQFFMTQAMAPVQQPSMQQKFMSLITSEFKLAGLVFAIVIIVQFVPFHRYISKYIAIEKIPYHDIILRGILAALAVIIAKKMFM